MESKETSQTDVENIVNDWPHKDLETQKKVEESCEDKEQELHCYHEHGQLYDVNIY